MGATRGLIYLHGIGMIHGDLKGVWSFYCWIYPAILTILHSKANILIDGTGNARLADFGLLAIMSDPTNLIPSTSYASGGTLRWMSPELIAPDRFGSKKSHPTKSSDCYALGMVVYETIGGNIPFYEYADMAAPVKVLLGEIPSRGEMFSDGLWKLMESCWASVPEDRPDIRDVLRRLRVLSGLTGPPTPEPVLSDLFGNPAESLW